MDNTKIVKENLFRKSEEISGTKIQGYDFNQGIDYQKIIQSYKSTGHQASHLAKAIELTNKMIQDKAFIFLGYTSSMVSSGLRDIFRFLVENKKIDIVVTTCGGIEEDIIKCLGDFILGDFKASGVDLREKGINRIGNIFVPNNRYVEFEQFLQPILKELYEEQKRTNKIITPSEIIWKLGEKINNKESICYWAYKNKIKIYCPAFMDGAIGDNVYFFRLQSDSARQQNRSAILRTNNEQSRQMRAEREIDYLEQGNNDLKIDIARDIEEMNNTTIGLKKSGVLILGSGTIKHAILNANMLRNGAEYAVYINTAQEYDGSDSGALPEEAVSWGKIKPKSESIKLFADATIAFPLIVAETFAKK